MPIIRQLTLRLRTIPAVLVAILWATSAATQADLPIRDTTLANGLQVIVIENHAVPLVTVELDVKNGSYTEPPEYNGLSHLYEHMFFKANRTIPSQEKYLERLRELGGSWNGTTSEERVNYFVTVGTDSVIPAMQFMEDAIRYPLFDQEELVRERPVVLGEFDRAESNPFFHLFRAIDTLLWSPAFYSRKNVIGNREMIATASQEKMRTIQNRYYVPNNSALILSGDITPRRGFELATEVFGDWPRGPDPFATSAPNPPPLEKSRAVIVEKPVNSVSIALRWHGPSVGEDPAGTYAADVLAQVLSNPASPFQKRLVDSGITFEANWNYYTLNHVGPITMFAQTSAEKLLEAQRALLDEVARFTDEDYFSQRLLEDAQKQLGIQELYERERSSAWAHTVGFWWAVAGLDYYRTYVPNMQKVTRADIAAFARRYLERKPYVVGVLISPEERQRINLTADVLLPREVVP
jgi:zinc protease